MCQVCVISKLACTSQNIDVIIQKSTNASGASVWPRAFPMLCIIRLSTVAVNVSVAKIQKITPQILKSLLYLTDKLYTNLIAFQSIFEGFRAETGPDG